MKCCICRKNIIGIPDNAEPVMKGRCCDECNQKVVIPQRLKEVYSNDKERTTCIECQSKR